MSQAASNSTSSTIAEILERREAELFAQWISEQLSSPATRKDLLKERELREQSQTFLTALTAALRSGNFTDLSRPEWASVLEVLADISKNRATRGFSPTETATFVFSLRSPLLDIMTAEHAKNPDGATASIRTASELLDKLGLYTFEQYQKTREGVISRQQEELLELSTPVVRLFEGVVAVPLIGTLDSARTQVVMENLLERIVETGAEIAIIDITGVPTVDTLVAQHLLKAVAAARLMGADCIISGIRPQIAQTIVHLGVDLQNVTTKATMADAFRVALQRVGMSVVRVAKKENTAMNEQAYKK